MGLTQEVASFVATTRYRDIPHEVIQLARGFILDGLGVALAGSAASEGGFSERCGRPRHGL